MDSFSRGSTLTPCRSPTPSIPVQPDHFYGSENIQLPPSPDSDGKTWLDPADDPMANRGIPVFKPTMEEFQDFEGYMNRVECWGMRSGIVKVIPPKEWSDSLPSIKEQLKNVKIKTPIEQHMLGSGGLFRQENMEKRKLMSVREWVELCTKDEFRAPGIQEVGITSRSAYVPTTRPKLQRKAKQEEPQVKVEPSGPGVSKVVVIKEEPMDDYHSLSDGHSAAQAVATPPNSEGSPPAAGPSNTAKGKKKTKKKPVKQEAPRVRPKRIGQTREAREAGLAERAARDLAFLDVFDPEREWLPPGTQASDYTSEFCQKLERQYWRNCGLGKPAWYGADTMGSLFTDATTAWNVAHLPSALSRLLPSSSQGLPGVNTPYLYFGMWRATFAWHVEDMDLFSINYIHFGAPKFWYAIPQGRASGLEQTMRGYFPKDVSQCHQFLRHKSFLASPNILANSSCRPNHLVQQAGEFVITFPRGYHAGFNLGLNCAESVNFALESWLEIGRHAKACECISDSVRIDVDQLLREREEEREAAALAAVASKPSSPAKNKKSHKKAVVKKENEEVVLPPVLPKASAARKRKSDAKLDVQTIPTLKKVKLTHSPSKAIGMTSGTAPTTTTISIPPSKQTPTKLSITLKLGPRIEPYPCCLCVSMSKDGLLKVMEPPTRKDAVDAAGNPKVWMAHEFCASIVPETWVDEVDQDGVKQKVVFGVDGIVKDRWNLKCTVCTKSRPKSHGAPVQCTKGKCSKAFHVSCAKDGGSGSDQGIVFTILGQVEKEVIFSDGPLSHQHQTLLQAAPIQNTSNTTAPAVNPPIIDQMQVDNPAPTPISAEGVGAVGAVEKAAPSDNDPCVFKTVKKLEVQILCTQHNPAVAAQKRANKNEKIRNDLLALPSMSRIKIRVSAGVFEVSLIRVIEETSTVEVLWDRGQKKEFKWGSVVFGFTDGPVLQKPSDIAPPEPERGVQHNQQLQQPVYSTQLLNVPPGAMPVTTFPSVLAATASQQSYASAGAYPASMSATSTSEASKAVTSGAATPVTTSYQPHAGPYDYWAYVSAAQAQYPYGYPGYYANPATSATTGPTSAANAGASGSRQPQPQQVHYNPYSYAHAYNAAQYRAAVTAGTTAGTSTSAGTAEVAKTTPAATTATTQLNWQQPYQGPALAPQAQSAEPASTAGASPYYRDRSQKAAVDSAASGSKASSTPELATPAQPPEAVQASSSNLSSLTSLSSESATPSSSNPQNSDTPTSMISTVQQLIAMADLKIEPEQLMEILRSNPQWQNIIMAAAANAGVQPSNPPSTS
ncbi:DNA damage-responsive transcriptional repressor RPH1 [Psilocybe cubensis]|uniref:DNA damage-responsive transcriptional repressor RPH1 n=1 Tax=Psilocybe cubensis TaxID=181762 RepID=A0ACB8GIM1_PSICU|nr:DNA damage-responsive transcriptional repressor RPH1 [Psilocybe cubensis]KAH9475449.1 DNA damage-responsive transcriptional repressor RPH1 [Psilocybe cubensis]